METDCRPHPVPTVLQALLGVCFHSIKFILFCLFICVCVYMHACVDVFTYVGVDPLEFKQQACVGG